MRIVPGTKRDYAHVELESKDAELINELQKTALRALLGVASLKGLRIEISEHDLIPDRVRRSLADGRYFVVE